MTWSLTSDLGNLFDNYSHLHDELYLWRVSDKSTNLSTEYGDIVSREIGVSDNDRTDGQPEKNNAFRLLLLLGGITK